MNAPAHTADPKLAAYAPQVVTFLPECHGTELETRCRLLMARDTASFALTRCHEEEAGLLQEIQRLGSSYAYAGLPEKSLRALLMALRRMLQAVGCLSEFVDGMGETDARVG
jgi:hypothetical protein